MENNNNKIPKNSPLRKSLERSFRNQYSEKDYYQRYIKLYIFSQIVAYACLVWSALSSFKFFQYYLNPFESEIPSMVFAGIITVLVSVIIGTLVNSIVKDYFRGQWDMMTTAMTLIVVGLMAGNVYADYMGVPELASSWTKEPVDTKTGATDNVYNSQIEDVKADITRTEERIAYIKRGCKTDDCYVTGGKAYWQGHLTDFGKKELRALAGKISKKETEIADIKETWNSQRQSNTQEYTTAMGTYNQKLNTKTTTLRGVVFVLLIIFVLCIIFQGQFGNMVSKRVHSLSRLQKKAKKKKKKVVQSDHEIDQKLEMEILYEEIAKLKQSLNGSYSGK